MNVTATYKPVQPIEPEIDSVTIVVSPEMARCIRDLVGNTPNNAVSTCYGGGIYELYDLWDALNDVLGTVPNRKSNFLISLRQECK